MPEPLKPVLDEIRTTVLDDGHLVRAVAAGRRKGVRPQYRRAELRWVDLKGGRRLQVVTFDDRQSFTRNHPVAEAPAAVDDLLAQPYGNWYVETADAMVQVRVTKNGEAQVHRRAIARDGTIDRAHDRAKQRLLDPGDPFLRLVGIADQHGRVKPARRDKYRQVEEFLRAMEPVRTAAMDAADGGPVRVTDLGCGNAYLSFAAYRWFERQGVPARLIGVDVKDQARQRNTDLAARLGWSSGVVDFVADTIEEVTVEPAPHLVLALHACDTATDDALARAVRWDAPVIMAAPCCHHDVQRQLRDYGDVPAPYEMLTRHGILRERFADTLTDAVRAAILRLLGYRVEVIEFVDSAHTPRNTLLRAVRTGAPPRAGLAAEYRTMVDEWRIRPALAERLDDRLGPVLDRAGTDG